jgi:O-antigen ligase
MVTLRNAPTRALAVFPQSWQLTPRLLGISALVAAICLSPRISLPINIGRKFDLRAEDIVLVILLAIWLFSGRDLVAVSSPLIRTFALYLAVGLFSLALNAVVFRLPALRAAAFWGKNLEFFLIATLVATWIQSAVERRQVTMLLLGLGVINLAWVFVQVITHANHILWATEPPGGWPHDSYGPGLIGEVSPLSVASFFLVQFLVLFAWFGLRRPLRLDLRRYVGAAAMLVALVMAQSRVTYLGSAFGAGAIAWLSGRFWKVVPAFCAGGVLASAILVATGVVDFARVTNLSSIEDSVLYRVQVVWWPLFGKYTNTYRPPDTGVGVSPSPQKFGQDQAPPPPTAESEKPPAVIQYIFGYGVGAMGSAPGLPVEAHNHFLRVLLETGIVGLGAFLALIVLLLRETYGCFGLAMAATDRALGLATLALVLAFLLASLVQDVFFPVIPNELLWLLAGLVAAARLRPAAVADDSADLRHAVQ